MMIQEIRDRQAEMEQQIRTHDHDDDDPILYMARDIGYLLALLESKPASDPPNDARAVLAQDCNDNFIVVYLREDWHSCATGEMPSRIVKWWNILEVLG